MYNAYHHEEPDTRTFPLPTAFVAPPGERDVLDDLRYQMYHQDAHVEGPLVDDVMKSIWQGLRTVQGTIARSNLPSGIFGALTLFFPSRTYY
jgi:hypothetical protein